MFSNQKETDTVSAQEQGYDTVRIRSSDSDVFFILLQHAFKLDITISFDTGSDNTRRLLIVIHIANNDGSSALHLCLFAHSRVGKIKPIKLSQKTVRFQDVNYLDV